MPLRRTKTIPEKRPDADDRLTLVGHIENEQEHQAAVRVRGGWLLAGIASAND